MCIYQIYWPLFNVQISSRISVSIFFPIALMSRNTKIKTLWEIWYYRNKKAHIFQLNRTEWSKWVVNLIQFAHMKHNQIFIRFPLLLLIYWRPLTISFILFWRFLFYFLHKTSSHQTDCMKEWIIHLNQFVFSILLGFYFV